jgi:hypothetical protein
MPIMFRRWLGSQVCISNHDITIDLAIPISDDT